ncbi:hypothetical protein C8J57DRAFT_1309374 [Mycena rebaudengoi]|nr:hypothetical protein C8J57DRAFT_1309374 [Mycena rebaudengoi]
MIYLTVLLLLLLLPHPTKLSIFARLAQFWPDPPVAPHHLPLALVVLSRLRHLMLEPQVHSVSDRFSLQPYGDHR